MAKMVGLNISNPNQGQVLIRWMLNESFYLFYFNEPKYILDKKIHHGTERDWVPSRAFQNLYQW